MEKNWADVYNSLYELRSALKSELRDVGRRPQGDLDQLETLLVLGEACCVNGIIPEFLAKLSEILASAP